MPFDGHPAGYVVVAILAGAAAYGWAEQDAKQRIKESKKGGGGKAHDTATSSSSPSTSPPALAPASSTSRDPHAVVPLTPPPSPVAPFQWPNADAIPNVNVLTHLTPAEVAAHPLLSNIGRYGLPALPMLPTSASDGVAPFHLSPPLLLRRAFIAAYNTKTRTADWCLERLVKEELHSSTSSSSSSTSRDSCSFGSDPFLHTAFQSHVGDYRSSGFDRGHLVPAADIPHGGGAGGQDALCETFVLSNIAPQVPQLNRGYWLQLENHVRSLTNTYGEVFAVTGPLWIPEDCTASATTDAESTLQLHTPVLGTSATSFVHVPSHFFKVILVVPKTNATSKSNAAAPFLAAFILPNANISTSTPLKQFQVPLEQVELYAGWHLFPKLQRPLPMGNTKARNRFLPSSSTDRIAAADLCTSGACDMKIKEFHFKNK